MSDDISADLKKRGFNPSDIQRLWGVQGIAIASKLSWRLFIPITYQDGSTTTLSGFDNTTDWDVKQLGDVALLANTETIIAAKKILQPFALGSNQAKAFVSVEDNA